VEQSVIHRTIMVASGRFAPGHLGELTQQVPFEMVDAALAAADYLHAHPTPPVSLVDRARRL
jgi:hypothetical protein